MIGFIDADRQWFKAKIGWEVQEIPREMSFCAHTLLQKDLLIIPDTLKDSGRFATAPLATHGGIRFYAGAPLMSAEGYCLGTLCVMDSVPRALTEEQIHALQQLATQVMTHLSARRQLAARAATEIAKDTQWSCLAAMLASSQEIIVNADLNGTITTWNKGTAVIYGWTAEEMIGKPISVLLPTDQGQELPRVMEALKSGKRQAYQTALTTSDGRELQISLNLDLVLDENGKALGLVAIGHDITELKHTQDALRQSEQRLQSIIESAMDAIITVDAEQRVVLFNKAAEQIFQCPASAALGRSLDVFIPQRFREVHREHVHRFSRTGLTQRSMHSPGRLLALRANGEEFPIEATISQVNLEGQLLLTVILRDIGASLRLEAELRQSQKMEAVGQLAGGIAHEFNNLLGVILGYTELLAQEGLSRELLRQNVDEIKAATRNATSLTRQLLTFSRKQVLEPQVVDLNDLIWENHKLLRRLLPANVDIALSLTPAGGWVQADPGQIQQVLFNLIINARDAMSEGGKVIVETGEIELDAASAGPHPPLPPGAYVMFSIRDTGSGMSDETLLHIFEPFYTTKEPGKGTGLGLSTVYGIVRQSHGHIAADSALGKGTTFRIYLPKAQPKVQEKCPPAQPMAAGGSGTILVVEDDAALRRLLCVCLESRSFSVIAAKDGAEAFQILQQDPARFQLIVSDLMMPRMNGLELKEKITSLRPGLRFLFMSGYLEQNMEGDRRILEGCAFLQKPFLPEELVHQMRVVLAGKAAA